ncbi:hypothetical protein Tco_1280496 [Tanacetum coccineum]
MIGDRVIGGLKTSTMVFKIIGSPASKNRHPQNTTRGEALVMDIQEKDKNRSQIDKTKHENGKSVKEKSSQSQKSTKSQSQIKSKSTPG